MVRLSGEIWNGGKSNATLTERSGYEPIAKLVSPILVSATILKLWVVTLDERVIVIKWAEPLMPSRPIWGSGTPNKTVPVTPASTKIVMLKRTVPESTPLLSVA